MSKVSPLPPSGFRDFLPHEAAARLLLIEMITKIYSSHGFQPIGMSMLENLSTLQGKGGGGDNEKLIFKVMKRGDQLESAITEKHFDALADMGLRFDLTLPLARYCARFKEQLPKPFKVFQIGPVWRADRPQKGRFREFYQCDVDIVGSKEIGAEVECIAAILEVFKLSGLSGVEVHLNDRRLLTALNDGLSAAEWGEALVILDKLDKIAKEGVEKELLAKFGKIPTGIALVLSANGLEDFSKHSSESISSLKETISLLEKIPTGAKVVFNPTLVRGQDYYTGTIFEIRHASLSGSLGGGGRYDRLLEVFGTQETPAFGGSIGFERLALLLSEQNSLTSPHLTPKLFFPLFSPEMREHIIPLAYSLRKLGIGVDVYPDAKKMKNQLGYADDRKIPFVALIGEDEIKNSVVKLKNMNTRTEESIPMNQFVKKMEQLCKQ